MADDKAPMKVRVSYRSSLLFTDLLQEHTSQAQDYKDAHMAEAEKAVPRAFTKPDACMTLEEVMAAAKTHLDKKKAAEEEKKGLEALMPERSSEVKEELAKEESEEEIEEAVDMAPATVLPGAHMGKKGKGKGGKNQKDKAMKKEKNKTKKKTVGSAASTALDDEQDRFATAAKLRRACSL